MGQLVRAAVAAGALIAGMAVVTPSAQAGFAPPAQSAVDCGLAYAEVGRWDGGFQGTMTVRNATSAPIGAWTARFTLPGGQSVQSLWNGRLSRAGQRLTVTNETYNGSLAPGASISFGFVGSGSGTGPPAGLELNGVSCDGTGPTTPPTTPPPTTAPPTTAPPTTAPPTTAPPASGTPVGINGQLRVCGTFLCNRYGKPIQLRGMSTHGIQWFSSCIDDASLDALADDWESDLLRIAMYVQEGGYETNPALFTQRVNDYVDEAESRGMYAMIDFHTLTPGNPLYNLDRARTFFDAVARRNASKQHVIYEIANEPNGVSWADIKSYAEQVIPVIRRHDPDAVVIVGTRAWSSLGRSDGASENEVIDNPVNATNVMYAFHYYAASHHGDYRAQLERAAARLPMFVTEFGTVTYTGGGGVDVGSSNAWFALMDRLKIGYANWTYSDKDEGSAALKPGSCAAGSYGTGALTESGALVRSKISTPDSFPTG